MIVYHFYKGKQLLQLPVCFPGQCSPFKIGASLKGKILLLEEIFFSLIVGPYEMGIKKENKRFP